MGQTVWGSNPGRGKQFISFPNCPEQLQGPPSLLCKQVSVHLKSGIISVSIVILYLSELLLSYERYVCVKFCVNWKGKLEFPLLLPPPHNFVCQKLWSLALLRHSINLQVVSVVGAIITHGVFCCEQG
jgi:hypothetical protein